MLLFLGLELSDHSAIQAWEDIITLAPWVPIGNLFSLKTWNRVETLAREREKHFDIPPPLRFYPPFTALKACVHPTALPPPTQHKEKARDGERSKESENNQLARRVGEETGEEQEKVKDQERSEESKATKRTGSQDVKNK